jgi:predicted ABC-type ATPase
LASEAIIIGGPNGAGKSTLAYAYLDQYDVAYLSADAIAKQRNPEQPADAKVEAGKVFFRRLHTLIERRDDFMIESTLAGRGIGHILARLSRIGYRTHLAFVFLDTPALCVRRVQQRVQRGGHDVPDDDIVRRFYRSKQNFWTVYRHEVDRWYLYYNAEDSFQEVAVGEPNGYTITDDPLFDLFMNDIDA